MEKTSLAADEKTTNLDDYSYSTLELGVWRILLHKQPFSVKLSLSWNRWQTLAAAAPVIRRFVAEIYCLAPGLVLLCLVLKLWAGFESTLMLYASGRLLRTVEVGLRAGKPDIDAILAAVVIRVMCVVVSSGIAWARDRLFPILQTRVELHFEEHILRAQLRLDLPTSADKNNESDTSAQQAWQSFEFFLGLFERLFEISSQLLFISQQTSGGLTFTILTLVHPVVVTKFQRSLWMKAFVAYSDNIHYLRIRALNALSGKAYREEVVSGNIASWVSNEYAKARKGLGALSDAHPVIQYAAPPTPVTSTLVQLSGDLPTLYWAACAILRPKDFTVTSFAILQQHAMQLTFTFRLLFMDFARAAQCYAEIKDIYDMVAIENKIVDGSEGYPHATRSSAAGMSFELRNVSFAYPGTKSNENAIKNVSLKIPAGHLVVIVGANGSGKSTIIKLLNRLYDVDAGEILLDGVPIREYRIEDLRRAQAMLTQEHKLYPLSLAENIGLGDPDRAHDMGRVAQAAEEGGAAAVIKKLSEGAETVLKPVRTAKSLNLEKDKHRKLKSILEALEKDAEVSGGEKQRLVAARTFMRFRSGAIRFAVADEPSSALDPKAEHQLFQRLRAAGDGKTMIFVTHRFGHLTKHADLIICMKEGEMVESGTHRELMALGGEYSELYNVQAQAFVPEGEATHGS
ncbi:P-loop containing nucleoside triphosphate hydrolase protein [Mycena sp. CBHHK59/15]|nr:P-loop containing nucleoside triphosphate hydrolase protein [Mycena sp. CBHHK59/15]